MNNMTVDSDIVFEANIWWNAASPRKISKIGMNDDDPNNIQFVFDCNGVLKSVNMIHVESVYE